MAGKVNPSRRRSSTRGRGGTPLGELLLKAGAITQDQLDQALQAQEAEPDLLGRILRRMGACSPGDVMSALNKQFRVTSVDVMNIELDIDALQMVSKDQCLEMRLIPFEHMGETLCVAMANVLQRKSIEALQDEVGLRVKPFSGNWVDIQQAIEAAYSQLPDQAAAPEPEMDAAAAMEFDPESAPEMPTPPPSAPLISAAPTKVEDSPKVPSDPFAGDPSQWRRKPSRRDKLKAEIMRQRSAPSPVPKPESAPEPEPAPPPAPTAVEVDEAPSPDQLAGDGDSYAAPMFLNVEDMTEDQIQQIPTLWYIPVDALISGEVDPAATEQIQQGEVPSSLPIAAEVTQTIEQLPLAQVVARSRDEMLQQARQRAELDAQLAAIAPEPEAPAQEAPVAAEPADALGELDMDSTLEPLEELATGSDLNVMEQAVDTADIEKAQVDDDWPVPTGPLPAVEHAVAIEETEFEQKKEKVEEDPVQEWDHLVAAAGPLRPKAEG